MKEERKVIELNLDDILPNRFQPRIRFDENAITELAESIKEHGVIQPIVVRPIADKYEIIAGERRYKASVLAGKKTIPAIVTDFDDKESAEIALIENVQRQNLTPIEEAVSYKKILDMGYLTQNQLADKLGKDQSTVANKLRLLNLDEDVQEALLNEKISERHARSLLRLGHKDQRELLHRIIEKRLTVRKTDEEINKILKGISQNEAASIPEKELESSIIKEEQGMEQNTFNIPDTTIIEEEPQTINPGFMDIHKIEENATNIFEEKPTVDMNNLLEPSSTPLMEEKPQVEQEEEVVIRPGKFFNLFPEEEVLNIDTPEEITTTPELLFEPTLKEPARNEEPETLDLDDLFIPDYQEEKLTNTNEQTSFQQPITEPDYSFEKEFDFVNDAATVNEVITPTPVQGMKNDFISVINTIRECANTIENSGFEVDVDEFDFEDMYQVIFKINKKK